MEETTNTHDYIDEDQYYSEDDSYIESDYTFSDDEIDIYETNPYIPSNSNTPVVIRWVTITLDGIKLDVSNMGKIKFHNSLLIITETYEGIQLHGTPYKIFQLEYQKNRYKNYYVHEIVWQAFNGVPPEGWIIRHKHEYTRKPRKTYSNRLACITIVPNKITPLYIEKGTRLAINLEEIRQVRQVSQMSSL
uniref:Uncharacterized protein n=1 Tax=viral metagenome TaxID=1070528 RepID=A0A6C0KUG4_9ZZZZ